MKKLLTVFSLLLVVLLAACSAPKTIVIGEGNWDSNVFHDQVAKIIIEEGYGETVEIVPADTAVLISSMKTSDINVSLELWSDNVPTYQDDVDSGDIVPLSTNFDDNAQGLYIPAYLQEQYPDLVSVEDLKNYPELFPNPEGGDLGIIYGGPEGWSATAHLHNKMSEYGLDEFFTFKAIDSSATLNATLLSAYKKEEPWVGYNWEPTWILGQLDMVLLEDSAYSAADFEAGIGSFPNVDVKVAVDKTFEADHPEVADFLAKYKTSSAITSAALAYMAENEVEANVTAEWFLSENVDLWSSWVTAEAKENILEYLG